MRRVATEPVGCDSTDGRTKGGSHEPMHARVSTNGNSDRSSRIDSRDPQNDSVDGVANRSDLMANCYAHLRSALSSIEELATHPAASPTDSYCYDQATGCVWVALVALAQCGPTPEPY